MDRKEKYHKIKNAKSVKFRTKGDWSDVWAKENIRKIGNAKELVERMSFPDLARSCQTIFDKFKLDEVEGVYFDELLKRLRYHYYGHSTITRYRSKR